MSWKKSLARKIAEMAVSRRTILSKLLRQPTLLEAIAEDDALLHTLLKKNVAAREEAAKAAPSRPEWFDAKFVVRLLSQEELLLEVTKRLSEEDAELGATLGKPSVQRIFEGVGLAQTMKRSGFRRVLDHASPEKFQEQTGFETLLDTLFASPGRFRDEVMNRPDVLRSLFEDERVLKALLAERDFRDRLHTARAHEIAGALDWPYPAVVCSYPRSGSNFLQSILMQSSGLNNQSIYGRKNRFKPSENTLTVKSHAPSPAYMFEEYARKVEEPSRPDRVVLLQRDPRDVMVSFYEYTQANRKTTIEQAEFLDGVDFFYASTVDLECERTLYKKSLTVVEAYREHVRTWFVDAPVDPKCLVVRYEDLIEKADETFQGIFDFLEIDCKLAREFLEVKVSLYSETRRTRGVVGAWRNSYDQYQVLVDDVHAKLGDEIAALGYDAS